jgi:hypothetical protein
MPIESRRAVEVSNPISLAIGDGFSATPYILVAGVCDPPAVLSPWIIDERTPLHGIQIVR